MTCRDVKKREYPNIHMLVKPAGPLCNLACKYCFYLDKHEIHSGLKPGMTFMDKQTMELYVHQYIQAQEGPDVHFTFQGGEPTLAGLTFFEDIVELVEKNRKPHQTVYYALQTNGLCLDDEWCAFLAKHNFLVGLSLDGPARLHDAYRVSRAGRPSHGRVMGALRLLQQHNIEFNTLTTINGKNGEQPLEVYRFLRKEGVTHMQFIPIVEQVDETGKIISPDPGDRKNDTDYICPEWSVNAQTFGEFYCAVYDEWVRHDVGRIFVRMFDLQLGFEMGMPSSLCMYAQTCGAAGVIEHNGDVYPCDHYVFPEYLLGNIHKTSLKELFASKFQIDFGRHKYKSLPEFCRQCRFLDRCNGGCPKHRFLNTPQGEPGLNALCEGYKMFFSHIQPTMAYMADCLNRQCSPSDVMAHIRGGKVGRNAPCPCGSGRKFKRCCGA